MKVEEKGISMLPMGKGPWKGNGQELKSCWAKPRSKEVDQPKGFITFSLSNGPEYHILQIADAVVITRYLGATLVLPDIRGRTPSEKRKFEEIYDVEKFMKSLDGVINIASEKPAEIAAKNLAVVRVPSRVSEDYIAENIEPIFRINGNLKLATYFPSVNMKIEETQKDADSVSCLAMFSALELQPEIHEVVDLMVRRLQTLSRKSDGQFVAVDLRVEMLQRKRCKESGGAGRKSCYNAEEVGEFLRKIGFDEDTTIYVTQSRWDESLHVLKNIFPKTYTKEGIMPADKKDKFLNSGYPEFEKAIDFYICSQSDVFVPAISGMFYANVAGKRISSGKTQILVPATIPGPSAPASDFISSYVSKKSHLAYSCFC
ncbi:protein MANNAN SYNTHESIS-RELATED 2-like isoform X2 [Magnolia sinica]|nr:protein MANNAN SYNTHESIS-RELATED 2-like isoform X2 [Magnolia sinica]XP_058068097.1 protein MANNAN SYNTHESIS-RELATED 2-like isoform X2 [Magnolia sinica]